MGDIATKRWWVWTVEGSAEIVGAETADDAVAEYLVRYERQIRLHDRIQVVNASAVQEFRVGIMSEPTTGTSPAVAAVAA